MHLFAIDREYMTPIMLRIFANLSEEKKEEIESWQCDCMVTVAALGFGDIPTKAFVNAFNIISDTQRDG